MPAASGTVPRHCHRRSPATQWPPVGHLHVPAHCHLPLPKHPTALPPSPAALSSAPHPYLRRAPQTSRAGSGGDNVSLPGADQGGTALRSLYGNEREPKSSPLSLRLGHAAVGSWGDTTEDSTGSRKSPKRLRRAPDAPAPRRPRLPLLAAEPRRGRQGQ